MHECVLTHDLEKRAGVSTLEIAKRLLDFGIHPPTIYFPLVVPGALMIEPTETETQGRRSTPSSTTMERIYAEALSDPELVKTAPHTLQLSRVDEARSRAPPNPALAAEGRLSCGIASRFCRAASGMAPLSWRRTGFAAQ